MAEPSTIDINIPFPDTRGLELQVAVGACRLRITPGEGDDWVSGRYEDKSGAVPLTISREGGVVRISQDADISGAIDLARESATLDLALGKAKSFVLSVDTGGGGAELELGAIPLARLRTRIGAGTCMIRLSEPNLVEMRLMEVSSGMASAELYGLANTNASEILLDSGAGTLKADFSGELSRESSARVTGSAGTVTVVVPSDLAARISTSTTLGSLNIGDGFTKREGAFWTEAGNTGDGPLLRIEATVRLGKLTIATE